MAFLSLDERTHILIYVSNKDLNRLACLYLTPTKSICVQTNILGKQAMRFEEYK
uniref:Uncharacterized protein n=1 Tax=Arundo donax TaxID=35708 RepID=A0A0A9FGK5_ARUDO